MRLRFQLVGKAPSPTQPSRMCEWRVKTFDCNLHMYIRMEAGSMLHTMVQRKGRLDHEKQSLMMVWTFFSPFFKVQPKGVALMLWQVWTLSFEFFGNVKRKSVLFLQEVFLNCTKFVQIYKLHNPRELFASWFVIGAVFCQASVSIPLSFGPGNTRPGYDPFGIGVNLLLLLPPSAKEHTLQRGTICVPAFLGEQRAERTDRYCDQSY